MPGLFIRLLGSIGLQLAAPQERQVAVLIDGDNVQPQLAHAIMTFARGIGRVTCAGVFASFAGGTNGKWHEPAFRFAMQLHHCPPVVRGKNASDIELVVHAMDLLHTHQHDAFVIVSSDSDLTALAHRIRRAQSDVYVLGGPQTPLSLRNASTTFRLLSSLLTPPDDGDDHRKRPTALILEVEELIVGTLVRLGGAENWIGVGALARALRERAPTFRVKQHGYRTLDDLIASSDLMELTAEGGKRVKLRRSG